MRSLVLSTVFACALAYGGGAFASPEDLFGFGAQSQAMGGLGGTFVDDYSAVYTNPAALSRAHATACSRSATKRRCTASGRRRRSARPRNLSPRTSRAGRPWA